MPITEASNRRGTGQESALLPPWSWHLEVVKAAGCHTSGTWSQEATAGGQFPVLQERCQAVLCFLPQYFLFPLSPCPLGQRDYIVKIRIRFLQSRLKKKIIFM